jgi:hypothetical protein
MKNNAAGKIAVFCHDGEIVFNCIVLDLPIVPSIVDLNQVPIIIPSLQFKVICNVGVYQKFCRSKPWI